MPELRYRQERANFINNKLANWREVINADMRVGLAGSVLSAVALGTVYKKAINGMQHEYEESWARVWTSCAALIGTALEAGGKQVERLAAAKLRFARYLAIGERLVSIGRVFSAIGGFILSAVDFYRAWKEYQRGNNKMATLCALSGLAGFGLAVAIYYGALVLSAFLLLAVVLIVIALMVWGDNSRHAWLDRCMWGFLSSERYDDKDTEQAEYRLAVGAC